MPGSDIGLALTLRCLPFHCRSAGIWPYGPSMNPQVDGLHGTGSGASFRCNWHIPTEAGTHELHVGPSEIVVIVGSNGTGKSALAQWLQANATGMPVERVLAHRQIWFSVAGPDVTASDRDSRWQNFDSEAKSPRSRWAENWPGQRVGLTMYDLMTSIADVNGRIADAARRGDLAPEPSPLDVLNHVLSQAGLRIQLEIEKGLLYAHRAGARYPAAEMSDGEKGAMLLAGQILVTAPNRVLVIDEPERHLHRSISSGLVQSAMRSRPDLAFVAITHDLDLASDLSQHVAARTVVALDCHITANGTTWDIEELGPAESIPDDVRRAVLGGRRRVVFVEGDSDLDLYQALLPGCTLQPLGGCEQVIRATAGIAGSNELHWIAAEGLVDGDGRNAEEVAALEAESSVTVIRANEIESVYFQTAVIASVAQQQANTLALSADELTQEARAEALAALGRAGVAERLSSDLARKAIERDLIHALRSNWPVIDASTPTVHVNVVSRYQALVERYSSLLEQGDLDGLVTEYPIRNTGLPNQVARALHFQRTADYERAVIARIVTQSELAAGVRSILKLPTVADDQ
jgi:ABC-type lipoprotein export system ATPase subunit